MSNRIEPLDFNQTVYSAFDEPMVNPEDSMVVSTTPDFVAMCDLLRDQVSFSNILEDLNNG